MDSLDAQCSLIRLAQGEPRPPDVWRHYRSGALSCAYAGGTHTFTWPAKDVREIARTWRDSDAKQVPERARLFLDAHRRLEALATEAGLGPADVVMHDLVRGEVTAMWDTHEVVLVIERIGESAIPEA